MANPGQFLQQIYVKNAHPVYGDGIRTHDLWNMIILSLPLDQGSFLTFDRRYKMNKRGPDLGEMSSKENTIRQNIFGPLSQKGKIIWRNQT